MKRVHFEKHGVWDEGQFLSASFYIVSFMYVKMNYELSRHNIFSCGSGLELNPVFTYLRFWFAKMQYFLTADCP
jgi:hypothetical protein